MATNPAPTNDSRKVMRCHRFNEATYLAAQARAAALGLTMTAVLTSFLIEFVEDNDTQEDER